MEGKLMHGTIADLIVQKIWTLICVKLKIRHEHCIHHIYL